MNTPQMEIPDHLLEFNFDLPHRSACLEALAERFPPEVLAVHVARLPAKSRLRLERRFGKLPVPPTNATTPSK